MTRLMFIALALAAKGLFDAVYLLIINRYYAYAGFHVDIDGVKLAVSYVLVVVTALVLPHRVTRPSDFLVVMLCGLLLLPVMSLWALMNESSTHFAIIIGAFGLLLAGLRMPMIRFQRIRGGAIACLGLSLIIFGITALVLLRGGALRYLNFDPTIVYEYRNVIHETVMTGVSAYLIIWTGKVVNIVALVYGLYKRRYVLVLFAIVANILLFGLTTHKEFFIYPAIALFVYVAVERKMNVSMFFMSAVVALLLAALGFQYFFEGELVAYAIYLLVFRSFYVIANLHFEYLTFFDNAPFVMLSNSILSGFIEYPFNKPVALLIGQDRFGPGTDAFANAGYIASAYMHFGVAGVFAYTIIVAILFRLMDALVEGRMPRQVGIAIAAVAAAQLVNTDLSVVLLTQGMMLSLVFLLLLGDPAVAKRRGPSFRFPRITLAGSGSRAGAPRAHGENVA